MTLLHFAEEMAGRTLFRRWANDATGRPTMVEVGSCGRGFPNLAAVLDPVAKIHSVGESTWRVYPVKETLALAAQAIREDPTITRCPHDDCGRCRDAIAGGPILAD